MIRFRPGLPPPPPNTSAALLRAVWLGITAGCILAYIFIRLLP